MAPRMPFRVGARTVLAMTCRQCNTLKPGAEFPRYRRSARDAIEYISRRCRRCWWSRLETVNPRNGGY